MAVYSSILAEMKESKEQLPTIDTRQKLALKVIIIFVPLGVSPQNVFKICQAICPFHILKF